MHDFFNFLNFFKIKKYSASRYFSVKLTDDKRSNLYPCIYSITVICEVELHSPDLSVYNNSFSTEETSQSSLYATSITCFLTNYIPCFLAGQATTQRHRGIIFISFIFQIISTGTDFTQKLKFCETGRMFPDCCKHDIFKSRVKRYFSDKNHMNCNSCLFSGSYNATQ